MSWLAFITGAPAATAAAATSKPRALVTGSLLNVRSGPGTTHPVVGRLPEGTEVTIAARSGDWYQVSGPNGVSGWVLGQYLTARLDGVKIVVDPGHGGIDGGAYANGLVEREVNLAISLYLRDILVARGAEVRMTRQTRQEDPPLYSSNPTDPATRIGMANAWPADMLLSVHNNASANTSARGLMTIWGNAPQSQALARAVHDRLLYWTATRQGFDHKSSGRGVYRDTEIRRHTLAITNRSLVPATIIEVAFVTNAADAALLKNDAFLRAAARGIADGAGAFILGRIPEGPVGGGEPGDGGGGTPGDNPPGGSPGDTPPGGAPGTPPGGGPGGGSPGPGTPGNGGSPGSGAPFPDVRGALAPEVERARQLGIVDGYPDGTFHPDEPVTRAAFAKMVVLAAEKARGKALPKPSASPFEDVTPGDELYDFILKAAAAGYIRGYGDRTFGPEQPILREQAAAIVQRVAGLSGRGESFRDVPDGSRFVPAVGAVASAGLMRGQAGGIFGYGKPITRAEAAAVAVRLHDHLKGGN